MTPLLIFLLGCAAIWVGTVTAAFSALMQLSLRLMAEGSGRDDRLGVYLDDPRRLFIPARILLGVILVLTTALLARVTGVDQAGFPLLILWVLAFALVCEHVIPLVIVRRDPERVLDVLLPSFDVAARALSPLTRALLRVGTSTRRERPAGGQPPEAGDAPPPTGAGNGEPEPLQEVQARALLRTLMDFRETMVREVMTPRPDIVAIEAGATVEQMRALFREQQYSRMPVFQDSLDNVVGFVFVKDLIQQSGPAQPAAPISPMVRPATFVPETKRVVELLREFQRDRLQMAVVVDEYGGTAGLVTLEDLIEEIVGEIRDEHDVEVEPVVDEGDGASSSAARRTCTSWPTACASRSRGGVRDRRRLPAVAPRAGAGAGRAVRDRRPVGGGARGRAAPHHPRPDRPQRGPGRAAPGSPMKRGFVALVGRPNAGKPTLLNRLVGEKLAIVSDKPQTTRNRIVGVRHYEGGEVIYVDTPGIHRPLHRLNVRMVDTALEALRDADVVVAVVDASEPGGAGDRYLMEIVRRVRGPRVLASTRPTSSASRRCCHGWRPTPRTRLRRHRPAVGADGRERRSPRVGAAGAPARGRAALSGRLPDGSARAVLRRRAGARAGAPADPRRAAVSTAVVVDRFEEGPILKLSAPSSSSAPRRSRSWSGAPARPSRPSARRPAPSSSGSSEPRLPRPARQGPRPLARGRAHARRTGRRGPEKGAAAVRPVCYICSDCHGRAAPE